MILRYNLRYQVISILADITLIVFALGLSSSLRLVIELGLDGPPTAFYTPDALVPLALIIWTTVLARADGYSARQSTHLTYVLKRLLSDHILASLIFLGVLYVTYRDYSRLQAVYFLVISFVLLSIYRILMFGLRRFLNPFINNQRRVLIVGVDAHAYQLGKQVEACRDAGLDLVGYLRLDAQTESAIELDNHILGTLQDIVSVVEQHNVDEVIVANSWFDQAARSNLQMLTEALQLTPVNIRFAPNYEEIAYFRAHAEVFNGFTLISLREAIFTPLQSVVKRAFDIVFSTLMLILISPFVPLVVLAIRLDSAGPVIFCQRRIGQHGKPFTIYKFRTMIVTSESDQQAALDKDPMDARVTRVGRFLRRTSLDEFPQFVNVLLGDMSVVGPRPEVFSFLENYRWHHRKRLEVPPGITGWWQTHGRASRPLFLNIEDDIYYIRNYSIWLDVEIVIRTVFIVLSGRGAY